MSCSRICTHVPCTFHFKAVFVNMNACQNTALSFLERNNKATICYSRTETFKDLAVSSHCTNLFLQWLNDKWRAKTKWKSSSFREIGKALLMVRVISSTHPRLTVLHMDNQLSMLNLMINITDILIPSRRQSLQIRCLENYLVNNFGNLTAANWSRLISTQRKRSYKSDV